MSKTIIKPNQIDIVALSNDSTMQGNFVSLDGDTMTGSLTLQHGATPSVVVQPISINGFPQFTMKDISGTNRGQLFYSEATGDVVVRRLSAVGAVETSLTFTDDGNVSINGAAPSATSHLTRKDYVDDTTVSLTGDTMTGNLTIAKTTGDAALLIREIDGVSQAYVGLRDSGNVLRSALLFSQVTGEAYFDLRNSGGTTITRLQLEDDGNISLNVGAAAPTATSHLTRKDYVDGNFVDLAGDTMTGNLTVGNGTTGNAVVVRGTTGNAHYYMQQGDGTQIGLLYALPTSNEVKLRVYDKTDGATVLTDLILGTDGNVSVSGAAPTATTHLTRKDYVDDNFVSLTGDTMTGNLIVTNSDPAINIETTSAVTWAQLALRDTTSTTRGLVYFNNSTGTVNFQRRDSGGAIEATLTLTSDGNATINGATPTNDSDLTRKDYVDGTAMIRRADVTTQDWNTLIEPGSHEVINMSGANKPTAGSLFGNLLVVRGIESGGEHYYKQLYFSNDSRFFIRSWNNSTWSSWQEIADTDYVDTTTVALDGTRTMTGMLDINADGTLTVTSTSDTHTFTGFDAHWSNGNQALSVTKNFTANTVSISNSNSSGVGLSGLIFDSTGDIRLTSTPPMANSLSIATRDYVDTKQTDLREVGSFELNADGSGDRNAFIDFHSSDDASQSDQSARLIRASGVDGDFKLENRGTGAISFTAGVGGTTGSFAITNTGNVTVTASAPTATNHLTRKDYVDDLDFAIKSKKLFNFDSVLTNVAIPEGLSRFYNTHADSPDASWNHCLTIKDSTTRGFQIAVPDGENELHFRNQTTDGAAWQAWKEVFTTAGGTMTGDLILSAGSQILADIGTVANPGISFSGDANTGIYQSSANANHIRFATAGVLHFEIEGNGTLNVAGTTNYETLVTADDDIPNKKYVDDTTVSITGDTMTDNLTVSSASPTVIVQRSNNAGNAFLRIGQSSDGLTGSGYVGVAGDTTNLTVNSYHGAVLIRADNGTGILTVLADGNASVSASAPTSTDHLTRKDYVDDATEGYTAQSGNATNTDLDGNPTQTNTLTTNVSLTTSNRVAGRHVDIFYLASGAVRTVTLNASWKSFGEVSPITVPSGKRLIVTLVALGTAETDIQAVCVLEN